ncbi:autophagy-related protein 22-1 [Aspergillus luchuensis]|uniref:Autophagy-related protein 22-1 n=1 Tax=Aspergillus kawachii TaxID=1069201 RepID=A0A146FS29_ASPKA|nr:autophagy-related protein 22-1 [Aspergillus luchuensis]
MHIFAQWLARLCPSPHVGFIFRKGCNVRARGASVSERVTVDQAEWRTLKAHSPSRKNDRKMWKGQDDRSDNLQADQSERIRDLQALIGKCRRQPPWAQPMKRRAGLMVRRMGWQG